VVSSQGGFVPVKKDDNNLNSHIMISPQGAFVPVLKDDNKKKPKWKIRQERRAEGLPSDSEDESYQADLEKAMAAKLMKMKAAKQASTLKCTLKCETIPNTYY
jgi:hypothetical protein